MIKRSLAILAVLMTIGFLTVVSIRANNPPPTCNPCSWCGCGCGQNSSVCHGCPPPARMLKGKKMLNMKCPRYAR